MSRLDLQLLFPDCSGVWVGVFKQGRLSAEQGKAAGTGAQTGHGSGE
jgi:hypothetical protein